MSERTHYAVLGIAEDAPEEVVEAAWKARLKRVHPDAGGSTEEAQAVNEAHRVLSDFLLRHDYDAFLRRIRASAASPGASSGTSGAEWTTTSTSSGSGERAATGTPPPPPPPPTAADPAQAKPTRRSVTLSIAGSPLLHLSAAAAAFLVATLVVVFRSSPSLASGAGPVSFFSLAAAALLALGARIAHRHSDLVVGLWLGRNRDAIVRWLGRLTAEVAAVLLILATTAWRALVARLKAWADERSAPSEPPRRARPDPKGASR